MGSFIRIFDNRRKKDWVLATTMGIYPCLRVKKKGWVYMCWKWKQLICVLRLLHATFKPLERFCSLLLYYFPGLCTKRYYIIFKGYEQNVSRKGLGFVICDNIIFQGYEQNVSRERVRYCSCWFSRHTNNRITC